MSDIEKIHGITPDLTRENVDRLLALFPDVATEITDPKTGRTERAVDFDALKERLGDVAEGNRERYQFTWPGKREAKRLAREPIAKTLRPVKERSKDWDTTTVTTCRSFCSGASYANSDVLAFEFCFVKSVNSLLTFFIIRHFYEAETA